MNLGWLVNAWSKCVFCDPLELGQIYNRLNKKKEFIAIPNGRAPLSLNSSESLPQEWTMKDHLKVTIIAGQPNWWIKTQSSVIAGRSMRPTEVKRPILFNFRRESSKPPTPIVNWTSACSSKHVKLCSLKSGEWTWGAIWISVEQKMVAPVTKPCKTI